MDIPRNEVLGLFTGQARIEEAIINLDRRLFGHEGQIGAIPYLHEELKNQDKRINSTEKKVWYFSGIGTAIGVIIGAFGSWLKH